MKPFFLSLLVLSTPAWAKEIKKPAPTGLPLLAAPTAPVTLDSVLERIENFDKKMTSLSAEFTQTVRLADGAPMQTVSGAMEYSKPSFLRIEHQSPERQTVVCDGKSLWVWRRETNQVIKSGLEDWKKSQPESFLLVGLSGSKELSKRYNITLADISAPDADGHRRLSLELKPKDKKPDFSVRLTMTTRDYFPYRLEVKTGDLSLSGALSRVRLNPEIAAERFKFVPPADADVFENFRPPALQ